jgi:predicted ATPase
MRWMKIKECTVKGFRSLRDVTWQPGNLNLIIGQNGSGKSNLMKALDLVAHSARGKLGDRISAEGGIMSMSHQHLERKFIDGIALSVICTASNEADLNLLPNDLEKQKCDLNYYLSLQMSTMSSVSGAYSVTDMTLFSKRPYTQLHPLVLQSGNTIYPLSTPETPSSPPNEEFLDPAPHGETGLSTVPRISLKHPIVSRLRNYLASWQFYRTIDAGENSPIRTLPAPRSYPRINQTGQDFVSVLKNLEESQNGTFRERLYACLQAVYPSFIGIEYPIYDNSKINLLVSFDNSKAKYSLNEVSDGFLRFLFYITILLLPEKHELICIDEPEIGLHPRMMGVLAECAKEASEATQLVFTTHSPAFLDAFSAFSPSIFITELVDDETKIAKLPPEQLDHWLKSYSMGELYSSGLLESLP